MRFTSQSQGLMRGKDQVNLARKVLPSDACLDGLLISKPVIRATTGSSMLQEPRPFYSLSLHACISVCFVL